MGGTIGNDLPIPTARSKDGEAFAFESECEQKGGGYLGLGCRAGKLMVFETPLSL